MKCTTKEAQDLIEASFQYVTEEFTDKSKILTYHRRLYSFPEIYKAFQQSLWESYSANIPPDNKLQRKIKTILARRIKAAPRGHRSL